MLNEPSKANALCKATSKYIYGTYLPQHKPDAILLGGLWDESEFPALGETIRHIQSLGIPVTLFGPNLQYEASFARIAAFAMNTGDLSMIESHRALQPQELDRKMAALASNDWHVKYISAYEDLCTPNCSVFAGRNIPVIFDTSHYTPEGATLLIRAVKARNQLQ